MNFQEQRDEVPLDIEDEPRPDSSPSSAGVREDFSDSPRAQTPPLNLNEFNSHMHRPPPFRNNCLHWFSDTFLKPFCRNLGKWICGNKLTTIMCIQIVIICLRMTRVFSETVQFWTTVVPTLLIITCILCCCLARARRREMIFRNRVTMRSENNTIRDRIVQQVLIQGLTQRLEFIASENRERQRRLAGLRNLFGAPRGTFGRFGGPQDPRHVLGELIYELSLLQSMNNQPPAGLTVEQINQIRTEPFVPNAKIGEEPEVCSICIDEFKEAQNLRVLPCTHRFHQNCVDDWLKISRTCPNCKAEVNVNQEP